MKKPPAKPGPAKGTGGRPRGPLRIVLGTLRVLPRTADWLAARGQTAMQALDELSAGGADWTEEIESALAHLIAAEGMQPHPALAALRAQIESIIDTPAAVTTL